MPYIQSVSEAQAQGTLRELYDEDLKTLKYVANYTEAMSLRPQVIVAWRQLIRAIRSNLRLRHFELVTLAAASSLQCTYCILAHGAVLRKNFFSAEQLQAIVKDFHHSGLEPAEVAMMEFAQKVSRDAHSITHKDIEDLRKHGTTDVEILDITLAAAARSFFSKVLDAVGAEPDAAYLDLEAELGEVLVKDHAFEASS